MTKKVLTGLAIALVTLLAVAPGGAEAVRGLINGTG